MYAADHKVHYRTAPLSTVTTIPSTQYSTKSLQNPSRYIESEARFIGSCLWLLDTQCEIFHARCPYQTLINCRLRTQYLLDYRTNRIPYTVCTSNIQLPIYFKTLFSLQLPLLSRCSISTGQLSVMQKSAFDPPDGLRLE